MPGTTFIQHSTDGGVTWSAMPTSTDGGQLSDPDPNIQDFILDPTTTTVQMTHLAACATGGSSWLATFGTARTRRCSEGTGDGGQLGRGQDWHALPMTGADPLKFNEWDVAELDNGDLLIVARINVNNTFRWQGVMKKNGSSWTYQPLTQSTLPHSGHPELLKTQGPGAAHRVHRHHVHDGRQHLESAAL